MKNWLLFLFFSTIMYSADAQHADLSIIPDLDFNNYRARFERRPAMILNGSASYGSLNAVPPMIFSPFGPFAPFTVSGEDGLRTLVNFDFRVSSNIDRRIRTYTFASNPEFLWPEGPDDELLFWNNEISFEQQLYFRPTAFWGQTLTLGANLQQEFSADENRAILTPLASADIFVGHGRIEQAQDALLAAWLLTDLFEDGQLEAPDTATVFTVAQTVTDLIGNRTFDLRRRRIYELEQLEATIAALYPERELSMRFFSLINDNWAFANRAIIQHGQEWRFGVGGELNTESSYLAGERQSAFGTNAASAFVQYRHSKIHALNRSGDLVIDLRTQLRRNFFEFFSFPFTEEDKELRSSISFDYTYNWFPNSRTQIAWLNSLSYNRWDDIFNGELFNNIAFLRYQTQLTANIFLSYQLSINFRLGLSGAYFNTNDELSYTPAFFFGSNYNIF